MALELISLLVTFENSKIRKFDRKYIIRFKRCFRRKMKDLLIHLCVFRLLAASFKYGRKQDGKIVGLDTGALRICISSSKEHVEEKKSS